MSRGVDDETDALLSVGRAVTLAVSLPFLLAALCAWLGPRLGRRTGYVAALAFAWIARSFRTDASGALSVNTDYFTSVELTGTEPQQVTYTINPAAVWSDGTLVARSRITG